MIVKQRPTPVRQNVKQRSTPVKQGKWKMLVMEHPGLSLDALTAIGIEREPCMDPKVIRDSLRRVLKAHSTQRKFGL